MKMNVKVIIAALSAAGVIAPVTALADTITPVTPTPPVAQSPVVGNTYAVSYPVTVTLAGGTAQNLTFTYNGNGNWTAPAGWTPDNSLNPNANTQVFTTTSGATQYGIAISSTGSTQFTPSAGTPATTVGPSVGSAAPYVVPVTGTALSGWSAATASGTVIGLGQTTAPLNGAPAVVQIIGVGAGGAPVGTATIGAPTSTPTSATSAPGSAGGAITVNSNQPNQSIGWGQYTATFPTTSTPAGTTAVSGTIAGSSGSTGATGIFLNNITGTASYNTATGVTTATPVQTATFSVLPNGNTAIGGTLSVAGATTTNGIANTGNITNSGNLATSSLTVNGPAVVWGTLGVAGVTNTAGIVNTGALSTTTLAVTSGITNTGNFATSGNATIGGTLGVTGNTTIAGSLTTNGIANTGNIGTTTLGVTGAATLSGATTIGSASGTGGNTVVVNSTGVTLSSGGVGGNTVVVSSAGTSMTGGGANLTLANGKATFGGVNGGTPLQVTGIANGQGQFDAVNFGQVDDINKRLKRGISSGAAASNIPQVDTNKAFQLGVGVGGFDGETGFAVGGSARVAQNGVLKASVGFSGGGGSSAVWGVGGGWSW